MFGTKSVSQVILTAFISGRTVPVTDIPDPVFSGRMLGDGIAVEPTDQTLLAPADGAIRFTDSGILHACAMTLDCGIEVLLHIGIDTVRMRGDGFRRLAAEGSRVRAGDPLIAFNTAKIRAAGYPPTTVMVVLNSAGYDITFTGAPEVKAGTDRIATARPRTA